MWHLLIHWIQISSSSRLISTLLLLLFLLLSFLLHSSIRVFYPLLCPRPFSALSLSTFCSVATVCHLAPVYTCRNNGMYTPARRPWPLLSFSKGASRLPCLCAPRVIVTCFPSVTWYRRSAILMRPLRPDVLRGRALSFLCLPPAYVFTMQSWHKKRLL